MNEKTGGEGMIPTKTFLELQIAYREIFDKEPITDADKLGRIASLNLFNNSRWVSVDVLRQKLQSPEFLEKFAELEHEQWIEWSKSVEPDIDIVHGKGWDRLKRWHKCQIPYSELPDKTKEFDRIWARKIVQQFLVGLEPEEAKKP